jgi:hypothetical protein
MLRMTKGDVLHRTQVLLKKVGIKNSDLFVFSVSTTQGDYFTFLKHHVVAEKAV